MAVVWANGQLLVTRVLRLSLSKFTNAACADALGPSHRQRP
jgi:hypothetical protein